MPLTLSEINRAVRSDPGAYVSACCAQLAQQISGVAELVCDRRSRSTIVLLLSLIHI